MNTSASIVDRPEGQAQIASARVEVKSDEFIKLLNRALNTMEPKDWPVWVNDILGGHIENGKLVEGMRPTDRCVVVIERALEPA